MKLLSAMLMVMLCGACANEQTTEQTSEQDKPSITATMEITTTARVIAIDHESRLVSLRGPDGDEHTFTAVKETRNLDQVEVGDLLTVEYAQYIHLEVVAPDSQREQRIEMVALARAKAGEMPGLTAVETQVDVTTVHAIDLEANTFKLKWPDGSIQEYAAQNPENLRKAAVGDFLLIVYTQAISISVEKVVE
jgi:hypothetical protein